MISKLLSVNTLCEYKDHIDRITLNFFILFYILYVRSLIIGKIIENMKKKYFDNFYTIYKCILSLEKLKEKLILYLKFLTNFYSRDN